MRRYDVKKTISLLFIAVAVLAFAGCDGAMHNTPLSYVTVEVINLPVADGTVLSFAGSFMNDSWNNAMRTFTVTGGAGSYTTGSEVISSPLSWSLPVEGGWARPWFPATEGNADDFGNMQNFSTAIPMDGGSHVITVDGSTNPATVTVE